MKSNNGRAKKSVASKSEKKKSVAKKTVAKKKSTAKKKQAPLKAATVKKKASKSTIKQSSQTKSEVNSSSVKSSKSAIKDENAIHIVGIGASAGGLEALRLMLPNLPADSKNSYLIVQHLDPKHPSMLASLLTRYTTMEVMELKEKQKPKPGVIYITPPDKEATISKGIIRISKTIADIGPKPSVDHFFTSLAEDQGDKAIGIILSGTGSDGAHGMRSIKASGGLTIVQDPETAKYNGMPNAAIETGHVDLILQPQKIGPELLSIIKFPRIVPITIPQASDRHLDPMQRILNLLAAHTKVNFAEYKINTIQRRIGRRMAVHKLLELKDYVHLLEHSPQEIDLLFKDILISVTSFFRDNEAFEALQKFIPNMVARKLSGESLRIWVAGCATGEEAYSLAILLMETLGTDAGKYNTQIFATDLDSDAIVRARKAVYPEATVSKLDKKILKKYFRQKDNTFQVTKPLREMVVFATQDITKDPPFSKLDLVVCRNLLIYFNSPLQKRILSMFHYTLNENGFLFLGKSETLGQLDNLFAYKNKRWKIYQRRGSLRTPLFDFGEPRVPKYKFSLFKDKPLGLEMSISGAMNTTIADIYGFPGVVIDDRLEILYIREDISDFLRLAPGKAGLNIIDLAKDPLRLELRAAIHKSNRENTPVKSRSIKIQMKDALKIIRIHAVPLTLPGVNQQACVVLFESETSKESPKVIEEESREDIDTRIKELEQELAANREHLSTTVEELETANEELQSLNEELQSSNEELQSSNEELETANEELQSTNEELTTVNEEYQVKSAELAALNNDLENIFQRVGLIIVIVDSDLKVINYSSVAAEMFTLRVDDIGQLITTVPSKLELPGLRNIILNVISKGKEWISEHQVDDRYYSMKILPYYAEGSPISTGAIITMNDITEGKLANQSLANSEETYAMAQRAAHIGSWDWNIVTGNLSWSEHIEPMFGFKPGQFRATYKAFLECVHKDDRQMVIDGVNASIEKDVDYNIEHRIVWPDGTIKWVEETGKVYRNERGLAIRMVGIVRDITSGKAKDDMIIGERALLDSIEEEVCIIDTDMNILYSNKTFKERHGDSKKKCFEALYGFGEPCDKFNMQCPYEKAIESGKPVYAHHVKDSKTENERRFEISLSPVINTKGEVERLIHITKTTSFRK